MEFFVCPCSVTGSVILDGNDQGTNKDGAGRLLTKMCNKGLHAISLQCPSGQTCFPPLVSTVIENTDPISPLEVPFQCQNSAKT
jgi:hypothetical protein